MKTFIVLTDPETDAVLFDKEEENLFNFPWKIPKN